MDVLEIIGDRLWLLLPVTVLFGLILSACVIFAALTADRVQVYFADPGDVTDEELAAAREAAIRVTQAKAS